MLGLRDAEHDTLSEGFRELGDSSVYGTVGYGANATAVLSDCPDEDGDGLPCYVVKEIVVDEPGTGYNAVPTVSFSPADFDDDTMNSGEDTCRTTNLRATYLMLLRICVRRTRRHAAVSPRPSTRLHSAR